MNIFDYLDDDQLTAATAGDGVIRVMAGAGSGKTTTLIGRVLYLVLECGIAPKDILVITFTNKAANEVRNRLGSALSDHGIAEDVIHSMRIGTFHSHCSRFLRRASRRIGVPPRFTIADEDDTNKLLEEIMKEQGYFERHLGFQPDLNGEDVEKQRKNFYKKNTKAINKLQREVHKIISRWKENGLDQRRINEEGTDHLSYKDRDVISVFEEYELSIERRGMLDFSDLIGRTCRALEDNPDIQRSASNSVRHLLVDEFQDVNRQQMRLVQLLSSVHGNVFVVGDTDQSIYGFRGSSPQIMTDMAQWVDTDVILQKNRRSTQEILDVANRIVQPNHIGDHIVKTLESDRNGRQVECFQAKNEYAEGAILAKKVKGLLEVGVAPSSIAVLVRTSLSAKSIETSFLKQNIPYSLASGFSFTEREEVKDILSYMRLILNPYDDLAFLRILNKPTRGLGPTAAQNLRQFSSAHGISLIDTCDQIAAGAPGVKLTKDGLKNLLTFVQALKIASQYAEDDELAKAIETLIVDSGYIDWLEKRDESSTFKKRKQNLNAIIKMAGDNFPLYDFIDQMSLSTDDREEDEFNKVIISTIHAAKGLEFDYVFCPSLEQNMLPHRFSLNHDEQHLDLNDVWCIVEGGSIQEERRLAHVAFTRAKNHLIISHAQSRNGRKAFPSDFLSNVGLIRSPNRPSQGNYENNNSTSPKRAFARARLANSRNQSSREPSL